MMMVSRRAAAFAALALLTFGLAACGDNEPERRKAFIDFLQTRIVARPGVHVPKPTDADLKAFGDYARHYALITDFAGDADMTAMSRKMVEGLPNMRSLQNLVEQRATVRKTGNEMGELLVTMNTKFEKVKAARGALQQPDDLKAVYDAAFEKVVAAPVRAFQEAVPLAQNIALAAANLGDYVATRGEAVRIVGSSLQAKDRKTQSEIDVLVNALNAQGPKFNDAQRKLRVVLQGS